MTTAAPPGIDGLCQGIGVVALVAQDRPGCEACDQVMGQRDVVALARARQKAHWIAQRIARRMNLGAQAAARPTQTLGIRPPLTLRAPAAC